jgi:monofunctional biosynthetic peptidoglycan transglycosylase
VKTVVATIKRILFKFIIWFFTLSIGFTILYRFFPVPITLLMIQRCIEQKIDGQSLSLRKKWVAWEEISDDMKKAVIASEDQNFFRHSGFDFKAIEEATQYNRKQATKKKRKIRGASTISQQTAKNVFLLPARNWFRKALEAYFTLLIEIFWNKKRILEVYLNVIETGNGIYGVEASAESYYGTNAKNLSRTQAAAIAAILPNPRRWNVHTPSSYVQRRKSWILAQMNHISLPQEE